MKLFIIKIAFLICSQLISYSQEPIRLTIKQPPKLAIDAGNDTIIPINSDLELGGSDVAKGGTENYFFHWIPYTFLSNPYTKRPVANKILSPITYVLMVNDGRCTAIDTIKVLLINTTGNDEIKHQNIKLYPVPAKSRLYIELPEPVERKVSIKIFGLNSIMILEEIYHTSKITLNLDSFDSGTYIITINTSRYTKSFLISKE